jgi:hypothetical protein
MALEMSEPVDQDNRRRTFGCFGFLLFENGKQIGGGGGGGGIVDDDGC